MPHIELRYQTFNIVNPAKQRGARDAQNRLDRLFHILQDRIVRFGERTPPAIMNCTPEQNTVRWTAVVKLGAHPGAGINRLCFSTWDNEAKAVKGMRELLPFEGEVDKRC